MKDGEKKKKKTSLFDLRSVFYWNSSGQERKFIYLTRTTCGYRKHEILLKIQARSSGNQRFRVYEVPTGLPRVSSMLKEVGIIPILIYFPF